MSSDTTPCSESEPAPPVPISDEADDLPGLSSSRMETLSVRRAVPADAGAIADIHVRAWQHAYREIMPQDYLDRLDVTRRSRLVAPEYWGHLRSKASGRGWPIVAVLWLASRPPVIPGTKIRIPARVGELHAIYVAPEAWRTGVGSCLMRVVIDFLAQGGYQEATVCGRIEDAWGSKGRRFLARIGANEGRFDVARLHG